MSVATPRKTPAGAPPAPDAARTLALARDVLATEANAISALAARLGAPFVAAVARCSAARAGSSSRASASPGHIARKLAATLASTGTPAFFLHPAEASHGDLGMVAPGDVVIMLSNSGETDELVLLTPHFKRQGAKLIALTGNEHSSLAQAADVHLDAAVDVEACPLGLAPTASTTAALALGDALALALLDARGFSIEDFARSHPGGALGRRLLTHVRDVMQSGAALPVVGSDATLGEAVVEMSGKGMGMTAVVDAGGRVEGIFTDGDLRRCLGRVHDLRRCEGRDGDDPLAARDRPRPARDRLRRADGDAAEGHRSCSSPTSAASWSVRCTCTTCSARGSSDDRRRGRRPRAAHARHPPRHLRRRRRADRRPHLRRRPRARVQGLFGAGRAGAQDAGARGHSRRLDHRQQGARRHAPRPAARRASRRTGRRGQGDALGPAARASSGCPPPPARTSATTCPTSRCSTPARSRWPCRTRAPRCARARTTSPAATAARAPCASCAS